ncbi:hypothetical protein GCM10009808_17100 [Microbacterium sediminicola]|uniref:Stress-response A/B barrel domain-containing protein n=1 Tax=Microbacterium sediminicola TaxID=415210 RepID=A0ABN2I7R3_9MICO
MTIRHIVTWSMAADDPETRAAHAAEVVARLRALEGVIPSIRAMSVGVDAVYPEANADAALVADFDDVAGLEEYIHHPAHQEVVPFIRSVAAARMAVDLDV